MNYRSGLMREPWVAEVVHPFGRALPGQLVVLAVAQRGFYNPHMHERVLGREQQHKDVMLHNKALEKGLGKRVCRTADAEGDMQSRLLAV